MLNIATIEDFREAARRRLPHAVFSYVDCAAHEELTRRWNGEDFKKLRFRQQGLTDISQVETSTRMMGCDVRLPVAVAPTGLGGIVTGGKGEIPIAKGAQSFGVPYTLGWLSLTSIEEMAAACDPFWFQILFIKDRGLMKSLVDRAAAVHSPVLVLTITSPVTAICPRVFHTGLSIPPKFNARTFFGFARKPSWSLGTLFGAPVKLGNLPKGMDMAQAAESLDASATWADVEWLRKIWPGKLLIKGIGNPEDAVMAANVGADGIVVSTHGGFTLDSTTSSISVLPYVVEAVAGRCEILLDSGVRSGHDVLKAIALGAKGCLLGRVPLFAAGAFGQPGVEKAFEIIEMELKVAAGLTGSKSIHTVGPDILWNYNRQNMIAGSLS